MTAMDLLHQLQALGVLLTAGPNGTLHHKAPKGVLTTALLDDIKRHKAALLGLLHELSDAQRRFHAEQDVNGNAPQPLSEHYPCVACGSADRWLDVDVWRCKACWPTPLTTAARRNIRIKR